MWICTVCENLESVRVKNERIVIVSGHHGIDLCEGVVRISLVQGNGIIYNLSYNCFLGNKVSGAKYVSVMHYIQVALVLVCLG